MPAPASSPVPPEAGWLLRWDRGAPAPEPPAGGFWPAGSLATASDGGWVALEGQLHDGARTRADLDLPAEASDAEVAARALARWGAEAPRHLRGSWVLVAWDPRAGALEVVRDAMGLHPAYYHEGPGTLLVSSSLPALQAQPEVSRAPRRELLAEFLSLRIPLAAKGETFLADVRRVPAAHRLRARGGAVALERWWDPLPEGFAWSTPEEVASFPEVLTRAVGRVLDVGVDSIALSGGYDSVGLATLAARRLEHRPPLHAVSLRFPGEQIDEASTQRAVAEALGMPQTMVELEEGLGGRNLLEAALEPTYESPNPILGIWSSLYTLLFQRAHDAGCRRMMFGTGGDEVLSLDFSHATDCLRELRLRDLLGYVRAVQRTSPFGAARIAWLVLVDTALRTLVKRQVVRGLGAFAPDTLARIRERRGRRQLPAWIRSADPALNDVLAARAEVLTATPTGPDALYVDRMRRLVQSPMMHIEFDQAAAWSQSLGFAAYYPFFDRDVVELTLRMNPRDLIAEGRMKSPLRIMVGDMLPDVTVPKRKVDFTALSHGILRTHGLEAWRRLGGAKRLAELGVVSASEVDAMWEDYVYKGRGDTLRPWLLLSSEIWLRSWKH